MRKEIRLYNYWMKIKDKVTGEVWKERNTRHPWNTSDEFIREELEKDVEALNAGGFVEVITSGLNTMDFTQKSLVGFLGDNGKTGEEFEITIGEKSLVDEIYNQFRGNNVRLILQVLNEEPR